MESINEKTTHYYRKNCPEMTSKLWLLLEECDYQTSGQQFKDLLNDQMLNKFNIILSENRLNQIIANAIEDRLILEDNSEENGFRYKANFDRLAFEYLKNDWYCFECHSCNENELLSNCKTCFRAFHSSCIEKSDICEEFECIYCVALKERDNSLKINTISSSQLNKLITFVMNNLELSPEMVNNNWFQMEESDKSKALVYKMLDWNAIKQKAFTESYSNIKEFGNDFKLFLHNYMVLVMNDWTLRLSAISKFEKRFNHEISELNLCIDCYYYSSNPEFDKEEVPNDWFTEVCEPPHELVFAKFGKYPYWPSKVIAIKDDGKTYDVRFFDPPQFSRALIPKEKLRSIGYKANDEELEEPLELLEKHRKKLLEKGLHFRQTITEWKDSSEKKRPQKGTNGKSKKRKISD